LDERAGPHLFEQLVLCHQMTGVADKDDQQIERLGGQSDRLAAPQQQTLLGNQDEVAERESLALHSAHSASLGNLQGKFKALARTRAFRVPIIARPGDVRLDTSEPHPPLIASKKESGA
jgi:hypothetical protein